VTPFAAKLDAYAESLWVLCDTWKGVEAVTGATL